MLGTHGRGTAPTLAAHPVTARTNPAMGAETVMMNQIDKLVGRLWRFVQLTSKREHIFTLGMASHSLVVNVCCLWKN